MSSTCGVCFKNVNFGNCPNCSFPSRCPECGGCGQCPCPAPTSKCNGDKTNNIFYVNGLCYLDQLECDQIQYILEHIPFAKRDLFRITTDPELLFLANSIQLIRDDPPESLPVAKMINGKGTLPYYLLFRGNIDGSVY